MEDGDFWKDQPRAQKVLQRRKRVESDLDLLKRLSSQEDDTRVLVEWLDGGEDVADDLGKALDGLEQALEVAEFQKMLGGQHDRANAIVTINSGAGGTDSQDWAEMLLRMYVKWADRRGFKTDITEVQPGEEAGLKSVTVIIQGEYAYGHLATEAGVHRLVRISPFDSNARRQTSFASVFAWPETRRRRSRSTSRRRTSGSTPTAPAGRGAARQRDRLRGADHSPPHRDRGLVPERAQPDPEPRRGDEDPEGAAVRARDGRSVARKLDAVEAAKKDIAFGSQIRSYVIHPYRMVKDHRTKQETGNVDRVLDGDLDDFIKATLMAQARGTLGAGGADEE